MDCFVFGGLPSNVGERFARRGVCGRQARATHLTVRSGSRGPPPGEEREPEEETSPEEWRDLIDEFEERAAARYDYVPVEERTYSEGEIDLSIGEKDNPEQFKFLKYTESASLVAMTVLFWWWGRVMRLDSWFQLLYAFPAVFSGMRWGTRYGFIVVVCSMFWINFTLGPFSALSYLSSQGLSSMVLLNGFWYSWPSLLVIIPCVLAKMIGFGTIVSIISYIYAMDILGVLSKQGEVLIQTMAKSFGNGANWGTPTAAQIQTVIVLSFLLHSIVYSICAYLTTSMLLYRVNRHLKRSIRVVPLLQWLFKRASRRYKEKYGVDIEETW